MVLGQIGISWGFSLVKLERTFALVEQTRFVFFYVGKFRPWPIRSGSISKAPTIGIRLYFQHQ
jgi:hypothetical protein